MDASVESCSRGCGCPELCISRGNRAGRRTGEVLSHCWASQGREVHAGYQLGTPRPPSRGDSWSGEWHLMRPPEGRHKLRGRGERGGDPHGAAYKSKKKGHPLGARDSGKHGTDKVLGQSGGCGAAFESIGEPGGGAARRL